MQNDWKPDENLAYNDHAALEITAKVVAIVTFLGHHFFPVMT